MTTFKTRKIGALLASGSGLLAIWSSLHHWLAQSGRSSDLSDFLLGVVFGVGIAFIGCAVVLAARHRAA